MYFSFNSCLLNIVKCEWMQLWVLEKKIKGTIVPFLQVSFELGFADEKDLSRKRGGEEVAGITYLQSRAFWIKKLKLQRTRSKEIPPLLLQKFFWYCWWYNLSGLEEPQKPSDSATTPFVWETLPWGPMLDCWEGDVIWAGPEFFPGHLIVIFQEG